MVCGVVCGVVDEVKRAEESRLRNPAVLLALFIPLEDTENSAGMTRSPVRTCTVIRSHRTELAHSRPHTGGVEATCLHEWTYTVFSARARATFPCFQGNVREIDGASDATRARRFDAVLGCRTAEDAKKGSRTSGARSCVSLRESGLSLVLACRNGNAGWCSAYLMRCSRDPVAPTSDEGPRGLGPAGVLWRNTQKRAPPSLLVLCRVAI